MRLHIPARRSRHAAPWWRRVSWRTMLVRATSLVVVLAVGAAVVAYQRDAARDRAEARQQACLNRAFQASLDERSRSTDDLIDALAELQGGLVVVGGDSDAQDAERQGFVERLDRIREARARVQDVTRTQQEADCG